MGENVQQSLEEVINVFEQLQRVQLFSAEEIKCVIKKCKNHEYRLQKAVKAKEDYVRYAQYLIYFLALIRQRRKEANYWFKKEELDYAIARKTENVLRRACHHFQSDTKLWLSRIEFAKYRRVKVSVSKMFLRMLQVHTAEPGLWILAAKWEFEENGSVENARNLMQRALRFHPSSPKLWHELFRLELLVVEKVQKRIELLGSSAVPDEDSVPDAVLEGKLAVLVFEQAMQALPGDVHFCLRFLDVAKACAAGIKHLPIIYDWLSANFVNCEETWNALALRKWTESLSANSVDSLILSSAAVEKLNDEIFQDCCSIYEDAVVKLNTEKMWTYYVEFLLELCQSSSDETSVKSKPKLLSGLFKLLNRATSAVKLSEKYYILMAELGSQSFATRSKALNKGIIHYPRSVCLWQDLVRSAIESGQNADKIRKLFNEAVKHVPENDTLKLWQLGIAWCSSVEPENVKSLLERGIKLRREVSCPLKDFYLKWLTDSGCPQEVLDKEFKILCHKRPNSVEFYNDYIKIQKTADSPRCDLIRFVYEAAVGEHGVNCPDLWLNYCMFESSFTGAKPEMVDTIYKRALRTLDVKWTEEFVEKFTLLKCKAGN